MATVFLLASWNEGVKWKVAGRSTAGFYHRTLDDRDEVSQSEREQRPLPSATTSKYN